MAIGRRLPGIYISDYLVAVDFDKGTPVDKLSRIQQRIDALQEELVKLETMPQDEYEEGEVVWFRKRFGSRSVVYTYAAVKAGGAWWISGQAHNNRLTWEGLLEFADWGQPEFELYWASSWEPVDG